MKKKNKWDIIGDDLLKLEGRWINTNAYNYYYEYYDGYYDYDYDHAHYYGYDYINNEYITHTYISKRGNRISKVKFNMGGYIDLDTIYSKEILREKKINYLLGLDYEYRKPCLGDLFPKKINNNED